MKKISILLLLIPIIVLTIFFIYNEKVTHTFSEVYKESEIVYRDYEPNDNSGKHNFLENALGMLQAYTGTLGELFNNELVSMKIRNICRVISDYDNNQYFIDNSRARIVKTDSQGNYVYSIPPDVMEKKSLCPFVDIAVDKNGFLYVLNEITDEGGYYVKAEKIVRYTREGKFDGEMFRQEYKDSEKPVRLGNVKKLKVKDDFLYFYYVQNNSVSLKRLKLDAKSKKMKDTESVLNILLPAETYISDIAGTDKGSIFYSTKRAEIYRVNSSGESKLVYSGSDYGSSKSIPANLDIAADGQVYFEDVGREEIYRLDSEETSTTVTLAASLDKLQQEFKTLSTIMSDFSIRKDGNLTISADGDIVIVRLDGKAPSRFDSAPYPGGEKAKRWIFVFLVIIILCSIIWSYRIFHVRYVQQKISYKQITYIVPIILFSFVAIALIMYNQFSGNFEQEINSKLKLIVNNGPKLIDTDRLQRISKPGDYMNSDYKNVRESIHSILQSEKEQNLYICIYKYENSSLYVWMYYDDSVTSYSPYLLDDTYKKVINGAMTPGKEKSSDDIQFALQGDSDGLWKYACGPLYNSKGELIGILESGMDMNGFIKYKRGVLKEIAIIVLGIILLISAAFILLTNYFLRPIEILQKGADDIASSIAAAKEKPDNIIVNTADEAHDLCDKINTMSDKIWESISEIERTKNAYARFVPPELLGRLGKQDITDVHRGDQVKEKNMTIMFLKIHNFYDLSKYKRDEGSFNFINSFFESIGKAIYDKQGFINKYLGAGIMALFPGGKGEVALNAAIVMRSKLKEFNKDNTLAVDIGIGIHSGEVMLGIVGIGEGCEDEDTTSEFSGERIEGTVISDSVNLSEMLENMTKKFGASILTTESIIESIGNKKRYQYRSLGKIKVEALDEPVLIYDVFQGDPEPVRKVKEETMDLFEEGVKLYQDASFGAAKRKFIEVIKQNNDDEAAKIYFFLCDELAEKYPMEKPLNWEGVLDI